MYRSGLTANIFFVDGILSRWSYTNIVAIGLRLGELNWVKDFIEKYKIYLEIGFQESMYAYNLARFYFVKKEYKKAMSLLLQAELDDVLINVSGKVLLLKMYYELNEFDALESLLSSFKIYLRRNKVISYHKTHYMNIVNFTIELMKLNPYDKESRKRLREKIEGTKSLAEKEWLLEQVG